MWRAVHPVGQYKLACTQGKVERGRHALCGVWEGTNISLAYLWRFVHQFASFFILNWNPIIYLSLFLSFLPSLQRALWTHTFAPVLTFFFLGWSVSIIVWGEGKMKCVCVHVVNCVLCRFCLHLKSCYKSVKCSPSSIFLIVVWLYSLGGKAPHIPEAQGHRNPATHFPEFTRCCAVPAWLKSNMMFGKAFSATSDPP